jgi:hypothetical protein
LVTEFCGIISKLHVNSNGRVTDGVGIRILAGAGNAAGQITNLMGLEVQDQTLSSFVSTNNHNIVSRGANSNNLFEGWVTLGNDPMAAMHAVTKQYVDSVAFVNPPDDKYYARQGGATPGWVPTVDEAPLDGGQYVRESISGKLHRFQVWMLAKMISNDVANGGKNPMGGRAFCPGTMHGIFTLFPSLPRQSLAGSRTGWV